MSHPDHAAESSLNRLDIAAALVMIALLAAIGLTVAFGDRAGVGILEFTPVDEGSTTAPIRLRFSEPMDAASVKAHFSIEPPVAGQFEWNETQLVYRPDAALTPGQIYTVTLKAGAQARGGRRLLADSTHRFRARAPRIAYLAPATNVASPETLPVNVYTVDPAAPVEPEQITFSRRGVEAFAPSPDGSALVYVQSGAENTADLFLVRLPDKTARPITNCAAVRARCSAPSWSPDGTRIVYERIELDPALPEEDRGLPRAWLLSLRDLSTAPLLTDTTRLGGSPLWSPDGTRIAVVDSRRGGILIYDLRDGGSTFLETLDDSGEYAFDRRGERFVYPQLLLAGSRFTTALELADLRPGAGEIRRLSVSDQNATEDKLPTWLPDGSRLALTRRTTDGSGPTSAQIYWLDPATGATTPLVSEDSYYHGAISFDPTGAMLAMQRVPFFESQPVPGIWVYEVASGALRQVAANGYLPRWLP